MNKSLLDHYEAHAPELINAEKKGQIFFKK